MTICTLWRWLLRGGSDEARRRSLRLQESLKIAEYRNLQAHDLLHEVLEELVDIHAAAGNGDRAAEDPPGSDCVKEDP